MSKRDRERAELQREADRLIALQASGKLPKLDTGRAPLGFVEHIFPLIFPPTNDSTEEMVN